jgi:co-chaperonin GroES (HSP10)
MKQNKIYIKPVGFRVLVLPDVAEDLEAFEKQEDGGYLSEGGIHLSGKSETIIDIQREKAAEVYGVLVAVGPTAWRAFDNDIPGYEWQPWAKVGDRVSYAKFGGKFLTDPVTGIEYMLLNDRDITSIILEEEVK